MRPPHLHCRPPARRQRGLTMIEMMISITIGLVMVGAIGYLYITSRGAYRSNAALSRVQEDGRFGLDAIMHDARAVGDLGCDATANVNNVAAPALALLGSGGVAIPYTGPATALFGVDVNGSSYQVPGPGTAFMQPPTAAPSPPPPPWYAGDVLQMVIPTSKPVALTADAIGTNVAIADNTAGLRAKEYVLVSNCVNAGIARLTADPTPAGTAVNVPVTFPVNAALLSAAAVPQLSLTTHPSAVRLDAVTYYVGQYPGRPWPALYRYSATNGVAEEVIDHVENMSVRYGIGSAALTTAAGVGAANWGNVTSVRVSLQVVGEELSTTGTKVSVSLDPTVPILAGDTRLRQVFTATAALRNRLP